MPWRFVADGAASKISADSCIVTQITEGWSLILTNLVTVEDGVPVRGRFLVVSGSGVFPLLGMYIGAVTQKPNLDLNEGHSDSSYDYAHFMAMFSGSLWGHNKNGSDFQSYNCIKLQDTITVEVQSGPQGYVRFWKNGKRFGGEWSCNISGPLVIAVQMREKGQSFQLLPDESTAAAGRIKQP